MEYDTHKIENAIGYHFQNEALIQQAFTRRSFSEENGGQNNEVLEFVGDKALDLAVIKILTDRFGTTTDDKRWKEFKLRSPKYFATKTKEGIFTDIKKDLVQKRSLAQAIDNLGFHLMFFIGEGDFKNDIYHQDSVKEDLFEAIIGAVTIDCDYDIETIVSVVETMIDFDEYFTNWSENNINYVGMLQEWLQNNESGVPAYRYEKAYYYGDDKYYCTVSLTLPNGDEESWRGEGESKSKARMDAAMNAYLDLEENGWIVSEYEEEVGEPDENESLRQVNELVQKKLISKPNYEFTQGKDEYGDSYWTCKCTVKEIDDYYFTGEAYSKRDAQRQAAYYMLKHLMGYEDEEE